MLDQIVEITELDEEVETIDIETDGDHLFFADNILVHNSAIEAEKLNQAHIQGGISKINTSDYTIGIKQDDLMRASGEIYLEIMKSRNSAGTGKRILLGWDPVSLSIFSLEKKNGNLQLTKKSNSPALPVGNTVFGKNKDDGLLNLMNI